MNKVCFLISAAFVCLASLSAGCATAQKREELRIGPDPLSYDNPPYWEGGRRDEFGAPGFPDWEYPGERSELRE